MNKKVYFRVLKRTLFYDEIRSSIEASPVITFQVLYFIYILAWVYFQ